jgi:hypothetical protein
MITETPIAVSCEPIEDGWRCQVRVGDDPGATQHDVTVDRETHARLAPGAEVDALVRESFRFLLEREARESVMRQFDLPIISRFFAEYESEIGRRMSGAASPSGQ